MQEIDYSAPRTRDKARTPGVVWGSDGLTGSGLAENKTGKSCLYLNKLKDVDEGVLEALIDKSVKLMRKRYNVR